MLGDQCYFTGVVEMGVLGYLTVLLYCCNEKLQDLQNPLKMSEAFLLIGKP